MIVNKYEIDGKYYSSIVTNLNSNYVCLETELVSLPNSLADQIEKVLEKYQIKIIRFLDEKYIKNFSVEKSVGFVEMAHNIASGFNENEIMIVKKIPKKRGFFEKFFQLFS